MGDVKLLHFFLGGCFCCFEEEKELRHIALLLLVFCCRV